MQLNGMFSYTCLLFFSFTYDVFTIMVKVLSYILIFSPIMGHREWLIINAQPRSESSVVR